MGGRNIVRGPAVTLPYSSEFMPRIGLPEGRAVLTAISELTGGRERVNVLEVPTDRPRSARMTPLLPWLVSLAVVLLLLEIAGRRLSLWARLSDAMIQAREPVSAPVEPSRERVTQRGNRAQPARVAARHGTKPQAAHEGVTTGTAEQPGKPATASTESIYEQAKRRARKRLNE